MRRATVDLIEKMIESKKTVDEAKRSLHNLVSLLLTQQRKTGGAEVVEVERCCGVERRDL
jgi:hypothetical protein